MSFFLGACPLPQMTCIAMTSSVSSARCSQLLVFRKSDNKLSCAASFRGPLFLSFCRDLAQSDHPNDLQLPVPADFVSGAKGISIYLYNLLGNWPGADVVIRIFQTPREQRAAR